MHLTRLQESILRGDSGEAAEFAMRLVTRVGDVYGADRLIPVTSAHVFANYSSLNDAGVELFERFARLGGKFSVPTTVNPLSADLEKEGAFSVPRPYEIKQRRIARAFNALGGVPCWSCINYQFCNVPRRGEDLAWSESGAVCYANSVIGARANRLSAGLDLACGLIGLTPRYGYLLDDNRRAKLLVNVSASVRSDSDYHTLGYVVGKEVGTQVPVLEGLRPDVTPDQLKILGGAAAAAGSVAMYHAVGVTPDAPTRSQALGGEPPTDRLEIGPRELRHAREELDQTDLRPDLVALGGPQYSLTELSNAARLLEGRRVRPGIRLWIYTPAYFAGLAAKTTMWRSLVGSGAILVTTSCAEIQPLEALGVHCLMTNSSKFTNLIPARYNVEIRYAPLEECIRIATGG
ncbi:MAG: aconitase X catalytic domain-containing protein [Thaumarchaeota archaeon]|nr:aconitase X catalytic domain-containing protein [Nitrososphaerota archaeon]